MTTTTDPLLKLFPFGAASVALQVPTDDDYQSQQRQLDSLFGTSDPAKLLVIPGSGESERKVRLERCGTFGFRIKPETGQLYRVSYECGLWRECPRCLAKRMNMIAERLGVAADETNELVGLKLTKAQAARFTRKLRDRDQLYLQCPGEDQDTILFDFAGADDLCELRDCLDLADLDFEALALTPNRRRLSGKLGLVPESDEETESIQIEQIYAEAGDKSLDLCVKEAVERTSHLAPTCIEELELACKDRMQAYKDAVLESGGTILFTQLVNAKVLIDSQINWQSTG